MNPLPTHSEHPADGLREAYFRHTQALLAASDNRDDAWRAARGCLHQRGFDLRKLEQLPLGYFPSAEPIWHGLLRDGFSADEIRASNLLADSRLPGRLVGPIRDAGRRIISFWAKLPQQLDRSLYLSSDWKEQAGVFGLDEAYPAVAHGRHDLLLVEDIWDAILLQSHGCPGVGAIGNSPAEIGPRRWERLDELGIHRVTLVVDSFHDSHEAAVAAIRAGGLFAARAGDLCLAAGRGAWRLAVLAAGPRGQRRDPGETPFRASHSRLSLPGLEPDRHAQGRRPVDRRRRAARPWARRGNSMPRPISATCRSWTPSSCRRSWRPSGLSWGDRSAWHDSWLEDKPSSNGSAWSDPASERQPAESHVPPEAAEEQIVLEADVAEPVVVRQSPVEAAIHAGRSRSSDYCDFHKCDRVVCLCWD